ncbi:hypothetical protein SETIT_1G018500v2 [Setaria italica]|uniref:BTB domain-containing protein n=1 Tax=Setaria italica TaxID=4555 RepID=A0A368PFU6_SETIT|nr:hypothetical protein SETIT_1G018500v2 [Setaria italica]
MAIGNSLHRGLGVGKFFRSATFGVGGYETAYDWCIRFYPDGFNSSGNNAASVGLFLELRNTEAEVRASFEFRLVDQATGQSTVFSHPSQATPTKRSELEASAFLHDDCLVVECDVTVIVNEPRVEETAAIGPGVEVQVPPSNLSDNLRKLLEDKQGADVTFRVGDEVFPAHKIILATRSTVFNAELFGPMGEKNTTGQLCIDVEDMHPDVFRALLQFIYTDTMPDMGEYAMERLKLMCEEIICRSLDVENVATMLALADQHHCTTLVDACAEFTASSNRIGNVVASQGYVHLKRACPVVLVDMLERVAKCRIAA